MKKNNKRFIDLNLFTSLGTLVFTIIAILVVLIVPISFWTDRTLDFWLTYFKGNPIDVPFWLSMLATLIFNGFILAVNIISEIVRLCI